MLEQYRFFSAGKYLFISLFVFFVMVISVARHVDSQTRIRNEINIPDIPGYKTLKCDFHMHTVFSDGNVWPTVRAEEVWREGLDVFSITDHIEYQPHKNDIPPEHNRGYEIALPGAEVLNLIIIRGAEITRDMPPGHLNAIFLNDANPLDKKDYRDGLEAAFGQGAFIFWNHPPFPHPKNIAEWFPEHEEIYRNGWMHGIEVANGAHYYPEAHAWCIEKGLTMIGTSDVHNPINLDYDFANGEHRTMTLVFANDRTPEAIKEALFARQTAVYWRDMLMSEEEFLKPVFEKSITVLTPEVSVQGTGTAYVQVRNDSDIDYKLTLKKDLEGIVVPENITLNGRKTVLFGIRGKSKQKKGTERIRIPYEVKNMLIAPEKGLPVEIEVTVTFIPVRR